MYGSMLLSASVGEWCLCGEVRCVAVLATVLFCSNLQVAGGWYSSFVQADHGRDGSRGQCVEHARL